MRFVISNLYYKTYMNQYYEKNRGKIIEHSINYYKENRRDIRLKQNFYFKNIYYPSKRLERKPRKPREPDRIVEIKQNVTVTF